MDWSVVIERNRERLRDILAALAAMAGLSGAADPASPLCRSPGRGGRGDCEAIGVPGEDRGLTLPRHLHRTILRLLRPAESAARRLIIIAARDVVVTLPPPRKPKPKQPSIFVRPGEMRTGIVLPYGVKPSDILPALAKPRQPRHSLALPLLDPLRGLPRTRRSPTAGIPRIWWPGCGEPYRAPSRLPPMPGDHVDATRLALRLQAIGRALDDLPRQAMRFARWRARLDAATQHIRHAFGEQDIRHHDAGALSASLQPAWLPRRLSPLRPGRPPGGPRKPTHEVHAVLADLQYFAQLALQQCQQNCAAVLRPELRKNEEARRDTS